MVSYWKWWFSNCHVHVQPWIFRKHVRFLGSNTLRKFNSSPLKAMMVGRRSFPFWGPRPIFRGKELNFQGGYLDPPCFCQWSEVPWSAIISPGFGTVRPIDLASLLYASGVFTADLWHRVRFLVRKKNYWKTGFFWGRFLPHELRDPMWAKMWCQIVRGKKLALEW